jgi:rubrerythrin
MSANLTTTSAVISFAEKLEDESSSFYNELAEKFAENRQTFLSFSEESKKNKVLIERSYRETVTDAIEACYSFENFNSNDYDLITKVGQTYPDGLNAAIRIEETALKFYENAEDRSRSLLATIPIAFKKVGDRRNNRRLKLKALLENLGKPEPTDLKVIFGLLCQI